VKAAGLDVVEVKAEAVSAVAERRAKVNFMVRSDVLCKK